MIAFLNLFKSTGVFPPREFICDGSNVLLNAAARVYSPCSSIEEYAEQMRTQKMVTRIRMDVAHFMNVYKRHLKGVNRRVARLYKAAIGQLLMTNDLQEAEKIISAVFLLSKCETAGNKDIGELTECQKSLNWLKTLVTGTHVIFLHFF